MRDLAAIDLFAGAGGLSVGLRRAGFRVGAAVEIDPHCASTFRLNHADTKVIESDIRDVRGPDLAVAARLGSRRLDLLTGCPPCQGFSTLRTRRQAKSVPDRRNDLILEFLRLVRSLRPRAVILENVPDLASDRRFQMYCHGLERCGYHYRVAILDAADFGVPQRRRRLVLVAFHGRAVPDVVVQTRSRRHVTVRDTIETLPRAGHSGDPLHDLPENRSSTVMSRIRSTPPDGGSRMHTPLDRQCPCHQRTPGFYDVYGRMSWGSVSPTITSGCNNPSKGRFLHPVEDRAITLREAALLQSFPKHYRFDLTRGKEHVAAQIGNAFPPLLILPIAREIAKALRA